MTKQIDHVNYPKRISGKSDAELRFIIQDCREAIAANPAGDNVGYYTDEIHYAADELNRRAKRVNFNER